jgi:hypothetical protein
MKLFRLIKVSLNETVKFGIGRCLCDAFPIQNAVKREGALSPLILNIVVGYITSKVQEIQEHISFWSALMAVISGQTQRLY